MKKIISGILMAVMLTSVLCGCSSISRAVVSDTVRHSDISSAKLNAQTVELAIKEAKMAIENCDNSVFSNASSGTVTVSEVLQAKKIESAVNPCEIDGTTYVCAWDANTGKVYFVDESDNTKTIDDEIDIVGPVTLLTSETTVSVTELAENASSD